MTRYLEPLSEAELAAEHVTGWPYGRADRVRFYELDALNHVNNGAFLKWFESIRVHYIQDYGFSGYEGPPRDPMIVVRHQSIDYLAPMFQNESYVVTACARLIRPSSFIMDYAVFSGGTMRAKGDAVIVSLEHDGKTRRPHKAAAVEAAVTRDGARLAGA